MIRLRIGTLPQHARAGTIYLQLATLPRRKLDTTPNNTNNSPRLDNLISAARNSVLNLCKTLKPVNHGLWLHLELNNLLRKRRDNVGERQPLSNLERVDGA